MTQEINSKSKNIVKILPIFLLLFFLALATAWFFYTKNHKTVQIDGQKFFVELALTEEKQAQGLGQRKDIKENEGMLFVFPEKKEHSFWMKDMQFDLDIIWIEEGKIVYIAKNVSQRSLETINPKINADKVLEIQGGLSDKYNFQIGNSVKIY